jgi:hypothetical protein
MVRGKRGKSHLDRGSRLLPSYKARRVNAVSVQRGTDRRPGSKRFRNYCGLIKIARSGPGQPGPRKGAWPSRISCSAALTEGNDVRLSSRKGACSSMAPPRSTGNPGSVYTNCETASVALHLLSRRGGGRLAASAPQFQSGWRIPLTPPIELSNINVFKRFRNYCGLIKIARSGFPWQKTTRRSSAFPDFLQCGTHRGQ